MNATTTASNSFPAELRHLPNWIVWKSEERDGKSTKIPYTIDGRPASTTDPFTWNGFRDASDALASSGYDGLGCVIEPPFVGIDLDKCRDPKTKTVEPWATEVIRLLDSYTEISPSGSGFHIWVKGSLPDGGNRNGCVEAYSRGRYFTVTHQHVDGTPTTINERDLTEFHTKFIRNGKIAASTSSASDTPDRLKDTSPSAKEFALACEIARQLGPTATEADITIEFFSHAKQRPKWIENESYVSRTIRAAMKRVYGAGACASVSPVTVSGVAESAVPTLELAGQIEDMPESVLDGRLGEIYERRLSKFFPRSYAWTSLVTVAGVMVPNGQTNLYTALVGPVNSGKSQTIDYVRNTLGLPEALCSEVKAGSAEGLLKKLHDDGITGKYLIDLDEWSHFFAKSEIQGSTLAKLLTTGFYKPRQQATIRGGMVVEVNVLLSWLGGIVEQEFESCFTSASVGGLYDRFLFGQCPTDYSFDYRPYEGQPEPLKFSPVHVDGSLYEELAAWRKQYPTAGRTIEIAARVAHICASADGRAVLHARDLARAKALMESQLSVRKVLRPNVGDNPHARTESTILNWMLRYAVNGQWVNVRDLKRALHYDRMKVGSFVWGRAIQNLVEAEDLELRIEDAAGGRGGQRKKLIRLPVTR